MRDEQLLDHRVVEFPVLGHVLERVGDAEQGQIDAPGRIGEVVFQQVGQIGGVVAYLLDGLRAAERQALDGDGDHHDIDQDDADDQPALQTGGGGRWGGRAGWPIDPVGGRWAGAGHDQSRSPTMPAISSSVRTTGLVFMLLPRLSATMRGMSAAVTP